MKKILFLTILGFRNLFGQTLIPELVELQDQLDESTKKFAALYCGPFAPVELARTVNFTFTPDFDVQIINDPSVEINGVSTFYNENLKDFGTFFEEKRTDLNINPLRDWCNDKASLKDERLERLIKNSYPTHSDKACQRMKALIRSWKDNPDKQKQDCLVVDEYGKQCFLGAVWVSTQNVRLLNKDIFPQTEDFFNFINSNQMVTLTKSLLLAIQIDENGQKRLVAKSIRSQEDFDPYVPGTMMIFKYYQYPLNHPEKINILTTHLNTLDEGKNITKDQIKNVMEDCLVTDKDNKQFFVCIAPYYFDKITPHPKVWGKWEKLAQMDTEN